MPISALSQYVGMAEKPYEDFWSRATKFGKEYSTVDSKFAPRTCVPPAKTQIETWNIANDSPNIVRSGKLGFQARAGPSVFKLSLSPLKLEAKSRRFARKFGAHRFLHLSIPSPQMAALPEHLHGQTTNVKQRLQEWLLVPDKKFMGYSWTPFSTRAAKTSKKAGKRGDADEDFGGFMVILFATKGPGLKEISIADLLSWFIPLHLNLRLPVCKAFARIDLGCSILLV